MHLLKKSPLDHDSLAAEVVPSFLNFLSSWYKQVYEQCQRLGGLKLNYKCFGDGQEGLFAVCVLVEEEVRLPCVGTLSSVKNLDVSR